MITLKGDTGERTYLNKWINAIDVHRNEGGYPEELHVHLTSGQVEAFRAEPPSENWSAYQEWLERGEDGS